MNYYNYCNTIHSKNKDLVCLLSTNILTVKYYCVVLFGCCAISQRFSQGTNTGFGNESPYYVYMCPHEDTVGTEMVNILAASYIYFNRKNCPFKL